MVTKFTLALCRGNSGSLVVDAHTYSVHGFVVALNPLGEAYISPLAAVMEQMETFFQGLLVQFPSAERVLNELSPSYKVAGEQESARNLTTSTITKAMRDAASETTSLSSSRQSYKVSQNSGTEYTDATAVSSSTLNTGQGVPGSERQRITRPPFDYMRRGIREERARAAIQDFDRQRRTNREERAWNATQDFDEPIGGSGTSSEGTQRSSWW